MGHPPEARSARSPITVRARVQGPVTRAAEGAERRAAEAPAAAARRPVSVARFTRAGPRDRLPRRAAPVRGLPAMPREAAPVRGLPAMPREAAPVRGLPAM